MMCVYLSARYAEDECCQRVKGLARETIKIKSKKRGRYRSILLFVGYLHSNGKFHSNGVHGYLYSTGTGIQHNISNQYAQIHSC